MEQSNSTSYQAQFAACAAAVDRLLAEYPGAPAVGTHVSIAVGRFYGAGHVSLHVADLAAALEWARLLGVAPYIYGSDVIQANADKTVDGVRFQFVGNTRCGSHGTEHDHEVCLEQARAEASAEPRCETCDEPLALIAAGSVGHAGDAQGNDCPAELVGADR